MERERWDLEVQYMASCRRLLLADVCPDTSVGDVKRMVFERQGCSPQTFCLVGAGQRLADQRALAHYADRLLPPAPAPSPPATTGRPCVKLQLQWSFKPNFFPLPHDDQKEIEMLFGAAPPPADRETSFAGLHLWEADAATMAHFVFLVEAPDDESCLYREAQLFNDWEPRLFMVSLLQMFRQQLLVTDYAHLGDLPPPLAQAVDRWTADGAGQARKATAMTALFAMTDTERAKRRPDWVAAFASLHPLFGREVRTLLVLAARNAVELQGSGKSTGVEAATTTTLGDLPREMVAMIADCLLRSHMADLALVLRVEGGRQVVFDLPWDWRTRTITTPPRGNDT